MEKWIVRLTIRYRLYTCVSLESLAFFHTVVMLSSQISGRLGISFRINIRLFQILKVKLIIHIYPVNKN